MSIKVDGLQPDVVKNAALQIRKWRLRWYRQSMGRKILSAMQGLLLISFFAPFLFFLLLSVTILEIASPHEARLFDPLYLFGIHALMVAWMHIQGDSVTGGPTTDYLRSLPINEYELLRVDYRVLVVSNNLVWVYFAIALGVAPYPDMSVIQTINFILAIVVVATSGMLLQIAILRENTWVILGGVLFDLLVIAAVIWPEGLLKSIILGCLIGGSLRLAHDGELISYRGPRVDWINAINLNRQLSIVSIDPILSMLFRWLLTDGLVSFGLRMAATVLAFVAASMVIINSDDHSKVYGAVVVGVGLSGLSVAGLFRTFRQFHDSASGYLTALPIRSCTLSIRDFTVVWLVNMLFVGAYLFLLYTNKFLLLPDIVKLVALQLVLLVALKLCQGFFDRQYVLVNTCVTVGWIVMAVYI